MPGRRRVVLALLALCAMLAGCRPAPTVRAILDDPRAFDGKAVSISGVVKQSVNLFVVRYYTLDDGTGELPVVTQRAVPAEGSKITATGRVNQAFSLAGKSLVVLVEDGAGGEAKAR